MVFWRIEEVPSAKAHRVSERKKINNQPIRTKARSSIAKVRNLISQGELEAAEESLGDVYKALDKAAQKVHGLTNSFLKNHPTFGEQAEKFLSFVSDDDLIIHNAEFDLGFINNELLLIGKSPLDN